MAVVTKDKTGSDKTEKAMQEKPEKQEKAEKSQKVAAETAHRAEKGKPPVSEERVKALGLALDSIKKQYGDGSIMKLGDSRHGAFEVVPTGALSLDVALGVGGLPRGRIIEIYGP